MTLQEYILLNHPNFNDTIKTEEDLKIRVLVPFLLSVGYDAGELRYGNPIEVQIGTKKVTVFSDVEIILNGRVQVVIDTKVPHKPLSERDSLQALSYAKLVSTPPALFGAVTNGLDTIVTNLFTARRTDEIPTKAQLLREINRVGHRRLSEIEIREVKSVLLTLNNLEDLFKIIKTCKEVIERRGLIRSDQSFREMTKVLLVKMNEERRARDEKEQNRFTLEYIETSARANRISEREVFISLFEDAKAHYPAIYGVQNDRLLIQDNECIREVVGLLEPWSFLGTGDDIKGAVYEIFLKSTLRGDLDQYFTPREIVDFIVNFCDPKMGDKIIDPACGSGGFLIQYFNYVRAQIARAPLSDAESRQKFRELVDLCLWGNEADYDLHVLAKINLIMHGDGYNHITSGDSLQKEELPTNSFEFVLTNPPFTIRYSFGDVLSRYELGLGKPSEELDILFVERCLQLAREGGEVFIVLPEGLLNLPSYRGFRRWVLSKAFLVASISLPEGAFIPFGKSVSKTCILGLRKKYAQDPSAGKPDFAFLGTAREIGYESGKTDYRQIDSNDLEIFSHRAKSIFEGVQSTESGGECGWVSQDDVHDVRFDAPFLLNLVDRAQLHRTFPALATLSEVCTIKNVRKNPSSDGQYYYLEVPDISEDTGSISNIRRMSGIDIGPGRYWFKSGDLLFTRINPRISRVVIIPPEILEGYVSTEVYNIELLPSSKISSKYVLQAILQTPLVQSQIVRLATGSSSSRARVQPGDLLEHVFIPLPSKETQIQVEQKMSTASKSYWRAAQQFLDAFCESQAVLGSPRSRDFMRHV